MIQPAHGSVPEAFLVALLALFAILNVAGALLLAAHEFRVSRDDYRFDAHRAWAVGWMCIAAVASASLLSRAIGARTEIITWPWLGLMFWICAGVTGTFWLLCRIEARLGGHPFWTATTNPCHPITLLLRYARLVRRLSRHGRRVSDSNS